MTHKGNAASGLGIGLVCPACGVHATPDPAALRGLVLDLRLLGRRLERVYTIARSALSRLAGSVTELTRRLRPAVASARSGSA